MNRIFIILLLLLSSQLISQEVNSFDIANSIKIKDLKHPYLVFSNEDKNEIKQRISDDKESNNIFKSLLALGNRLLYQPVDYNIPVQGKNARADWTEADRDGKYESFYKLNLQNALTLAFLYQMTEEKKYARKAFQFADAFCDLPTWTFRIHEFPIIYDRVMPWNVPDDQVSFSFDHYNGDAGRDMAYIYDWIYQALDQKERDRLRGALIEKVITKVRGNYEFHWWATAYRCNWCGVCNSGVGMAALALINEHPQLSDVLAESYNRINLMLNELGEDGGWQEGASYWSYALRTSSQYAKALQRATNGKFDLFKNEKLQSNPASFPLYTYVQPNRSLNFADSRNRIIGPTYLINLLATETGDEDAIWYRQNILGEGTSWADLVWPRPNVDIEAPNYKSKHFKTIDFWIMRTDFTNTENVIVAGKAGMNDDPHHGHLDVGNIVIFWKGLGYISEMPKIFYDQIYFNEERWDYPYASSYGHNLVFVNNEPQISGKYYKQPFNYDIGGKVLKFETNDNLDYVIMDPTNAYEQKYLKKWKRHIQLDKRKNITIVIDEVNSEIGANIEARFHSEVDIICKEDYVLLSEKFNNIESNKVNELNNSMVLIPIVSNGYSLAKDKHVVLPVNASQEIRWVPYFTIAKIAEQKQTQIVSIILPISSLPISSLDDIKAILNSAQLKNTNGKTKLSFNLKNEDFTYYFLSDNN